MSAFYLLLPVAAGFVAAAVTVFVWAVKHGQLDDLETPAIRAVLDDAEEGS